MKQATPRPRLVIVSDWIRRDLHEPLRHFRTFEVIHLYRQAGYHDMTPDDFRRPRAIGWNSLVALWRQLVKARPTILQGAEPWATRPSLLISLVTWFYQRTHPEVVLIWSSMENRPLANKFSGLMVRLLAWWGRHYGRAARVVMSLNAGARRNLIEIGIPLSRIQPVRWATWGVDCREFKPRSKTEEQPIILFVGKVSRAKGVPWLVEAFETVRRDFPRAELWVAGPPGDLGAAHLTRPGITSLGIIKNRDLPSLYRQAAIVVAPSITTRSWEEQVGMVNLQAMACGVPVVTTRSGAIPEYVRDGEGALLVPEQDSRSIVQAIERLLRNPKERIALGQRGRTYVCSHYEVRDNITRIERQLLALLGSGSWTEAT